MRALPPVVCGFILIFAATLGAYAAAQPVLVKDIVPGDGSFLLNGPLSFKALGPRVIFSQYLRNPDPSIPGRYALWVSDGTTAGTSSLREFKTLTGATMTVCGAQAFFIAAEGSGGDALWRTDGTVAGTRLVKTLGTVGTADPHEEFVTLGNLLYFSPIINGQRSLWRSDGTATGTYRVMEHLRNDAMSLTTVDDQVYFLADYGDGYGLWLIERLTGLPALAQDLTPAPGDRSTVPFSFAAAGGVLYFLRGDSAGSRFLLWRSDGTSAGTKPIDLHPEPFFYRLMAYGDRVILWGIEPEHHSEPWISDGTAAGTHLLKDLHPGGQSATPHHVTTIGGRAFIYVTPSDTTDELWISDGTGGNTHLLTSFESNHYHIPDEHLGTSMIDGGGLLYYVDIDKNHWSEGQQLWQSDGTTAGTKRVVENPPAGFQVMQYPLLKAGSRLFFFADDSAHGLELWTLALPPSPTVVPPTSPSSTPSANAGSPSGCGKGSGIAAMAGLLLALGMMRLRGASAGPR